MTTEAKHAAQAHGVTALTPAVQEWIASNIKTVLVGDPTESSYAHVNVWQLTAEDDPANVTAASRIGEALRAQPGFRSYTVIRTGPREVVAVTRFESQARLEAALKTIASLVRERVAPLAARAPERRAGPVLYRTAA